VARERDRREAAAAIRRLLDAVERGEISADSPQERRMLRRLEGAAAAWTADEKPPTKSVEEPS
jgi:hypothetical protein